MLQKSLMFALVLLVVSASATEFARHKNTKNFRSNKPRGQQLLHLSDAIIKAYGQTPCLNRQIGERLPHPTNTHKFLRCMSLETLWIERCPDGLFYNPTDKLCDWSVKPRKTTTNKTPINVKHRPIRFRTAFLKSRSKFVKDHSKEEKFEQSAPIGQSRFEEEESSFKTETTTMSLIDQLRAKLHKKTSHKKVESDFEF